MEFLRYPLHEGLYVNHVLVTPPAAESKHFERAPSPGRVNEWLSKGFSIHEHPFRRRFAEDRRRATPPRPTRDGQSVQAGCFLVADSRRFGPLEPYFPFGNVNVDRSTFYFEPTALRRYAYWIIDSQAEMDVDLRIWTCGAVTLWMDEALLLDFAPFTRNMVKRREVLLRLKRGKNHFFLCHDDLAERDTDYYFRIALTPAGVPSSHWESAGLIEPVILIPLPDGCDPEEVLRTEAALARLHTTRECVASDGPVLSTERAGAFLPAAQAGPKPIPVSYSYIAGETTDVSTTPRGSFDAAAPEPVKLVPYDGDSPAILRIVLERELDGLRIARTLGVQVADTEAMSGQAIGLSISDRKRKAIEFLAASRSDDVYAALARLAVGNSEDSGIHEDAPPTAKAAQVATSVETSLRSALDRVDKRYDCADFALVSLIHAYMEFGNRLSACLNERIRNSLAGFRYWCDEPGNDVMWFFSENHALLFHTCELLAGTLLPDRIFSNTGLTGREHRRKAIALLDAWFERFFAESITEWNSSAYIPVDVHGLAALHRLCDVPHLRDNAKKALDSLFRTLALYSFHGVLMGTAGRCYEKELRANQVAGTTALLWIGFGTGRQNHAGLAYTELCLSDYEPPEALIDYIQRGEQNLRRMAESGNGLLFTNTQGLDRHVHCCLYKTPRAMLSCAVDFRPGTPGYQEHILHAALSPTAQCWVNQPGETRPGGGGRPSFWAGNGLLPRVIQYRNLAVMLYNGANNPAAYDPIVDWTHAYLPLMEFDEFLTGPDSAVARVGDACLGIRAVNGLAFISEGETAGREARSPGLRNAWLVYVDGEGHFPDIVAFKAYFDALGFEFHEEGVSQGSGPVASLEHPEYGLIEVPWKGPALAHGEPLRYGSADPEGEIELW